MEKKQFEQNVIKQLSENYSVMAKQIVTIKFNKQLRICSIDLSPYVDQAFGFIDPDFPHAFASINDSEQYPEEEIQWLPAQKLTEKTNYSDAITSIDSSLFNKKSIGLALTLINWFAGRVFNQLFLRVKSQNHLYSFDVMVDGIFMSIAIDSFVPLDPVTKKERFSKNFNGSIFPCLYQKLMAKIYGDYYSITSEFIDIVQIQTFFCRQEVSITKGISLVELQGLISKKLLQKSIVCFRTRNSIRLESFGLESNHIYVILRVINKFGEWIVQFLELEGQSWIGKFSKLRSSWWLEEKRFVETNSIAIHNPEYKQNYMSLGDMKGIGRQLVILNNTFDFHKNYYVCHNNSNYLTMYEINLEKSNKVMLRVNYKHKKCYNSIFIIQKVSQQSRNNGSRLVMSCFHQSKDSNYVQTTLQPGAYFVVVYSTHPQQLNLAYNITVFSSQSFVKMTPCYSFETILKVLENSFKSYFQSLAVEKKEQIVFKQIYDTTGLAFIFVRPSLNCSIELTFKKRIFQQSKILNLNQTENADQQQFTMITKGGSSDLLIFRCLWSKKENIVFQIDHKTETERMVFPPLGSIKVVQRRPK